MCFNYRLVIFSSRRRHTRWNCDWSSDVCSSDIEDQVIKRNRYHKAGQKRSYQHCQKDLPVKFIRESSVPLVSFHFYTPRVCFYTMPLRLKGCCPCQSSALLRPQEAA